MVSCAYRGNEARGPLWLDPVGRPDTEARQPHNAHKKPRRSGAQGPLIVTWIRERERGPERTSDPSANVAADPLCPISPEEYESAPSPTQLSISVQMGPLPASCSTSGRLTIAFPPET